MAMAKDKQRLLTAADLARQLGVAPSTVTRWIARGELRPTNTLKLGGRQIHLFPPAAIEAARAVQRGKHPGRPRKRRTRP